MGGLRSAAPTELAQFKPILGILFVLLGGVIALFADSAGERDYDAIFFTFGRHKSPFASQAIGLVCAFAVPSQTLWP
jgi:hypothetical protein